METLERLEIRMDTVEREVNFLKTQVALHEQAIKDIKDDIRAIRSNTTWVLRLVLGTLIMAVLGYFLKGGQV